jgi:uncharacterized protein
MSLFAYALERTWHTFSVNWPLLLISVLIATALKLYVDQRKVAAFLKRNQKAGVIGATAVAVTTPLCSCGTTAVILGMMASMVSWAPIVAFMVASPLTSPQELVYSAGLFGWPFAIAFFASSILLGLAGGAVAYVLERSGWLKGQYRLQPMAGGQAGEMAVGAGTAASGADAGVAADEAGTGSGAGASRSGLRAFGAEFAGVGGRLLLLFLGFAFIGYLLNGLIPEAWIINLFGSGKIYGVPLAATLGLPLYVNTEASLPLVRSFLDLGMSPGATLAFLITGAGTSLGALTGALTIARWRVVAVVVGTLWVGAIAIGYAYNALVTLGLV